MKGAAGERVIVGRLAGVYGVQGWFRVESYTDPIEALLGYGHWQVRRDGHWAPAGVEAARRHGKGLVAKLGVADDREAAQAWVGCEVAVPRSELAETVPGEYYWSDLIGLAVETLTGRDLGTVTGLIETGAHDVLVARRNDVETLVPFVIDRYVRDVDLNAGRIVVDWDWD